jgi:phenylacetate-CoA ligase
MIATHISDLFSGKNVAKYYSLYKKTQWYSESEMRSFQLNKLNLLVKHCYRNIPFYQAYMDRNSIKVQDIDSIEKLKLFPIITKDIIQENYKSFIPVNIREIKGIKTSQTGGTTGNILIKRNDAETRSSIWATYKRFHDDWMGVKEFDRKLVLMGGHIKNTTLKDKARLSFLSLLNNSVTFSPYDTSEKNFQKIVKTLDKGTTKLIRGYVQHLFQLAKFLKSVNKKYDIRAITTTAEPILGHHRSLFKEVFNTDVFDQYGFGEIGGVSYECNHHKGMHIADERVIIETNDMNELIVTDLDNYSMPFIRYWNADQAIISAEKCSCGRQSKLIDKIMGRTCDYVIGQDDQQLHWAFFWHLFFDSKIEHENGLRKFQVLQNDKSSLLIRLVVNKELNISQRDFIIKHIQDRLGEINVDFSFEEEIENTKTGKYRPVINNLLLD